MFAERQKPKITQGSKFCHLLSLMPFLNSYEFFGTQRQINIMKVNGHYRSVKLQNV